MKVGAHLSIAGGYINPLEKIKTIGGNCLQIFSSSPRIWGVDQPPPEVITVFKEKKTELQVDPIFFHASYLINLANPGRIGRSSVTTLRKERMLAYEMEVQGTIIHLGSFNAEGNSYEVLLNNIADVLRDAPEEPQFIIENAGNRKIGRSIEEIGQIISDLRDDRVKVCLDTCHLFAAGYDLATKEAYDRFFDNFDTSIGLEKLVVIQVNDSKDTLGSFRDRHENIGEGNIPPETFRLYVNEQATKNIPFILETPGFDKKGPDKKNIDRFLSCEYREN